MGFQLIIAEGRESGREFVFDQASILIGRVDECDVVLFESGVSRRHARISLAGDDYVIEDQGSSNGTLVNGKKVTRQSLKDGDAIGLGPVVFTFSKVGIDAADAPTAENPQAGNHTRIVDASELKRSRNKGVVAMPKGKDRVELAEMRQRSTQMVPALKLSDLEAPAPKAARAPVRSAPEGKARPSQPQALDGVKVGGAAVLSAADKARLRREAGTGLSGKARVYWAEASPQRRQRVVAGGAVGAALLLAFVTWAAWPKHARRPLVEPTTLSAEPLSASFGLGEGVTFERLDQKSFEFSVKSPVKVIAILHLQAKDIAPDEVSVTVNGTELGYLPPDTLNTSERTIELIVPTEAVTRDAVNTVVFDNIQNPPAEETWRIWNLWVEVAMLPERDPAGLLADAQERYQRAVVMWDQRDIGARNRWEAYRGFREAWLTLESLPKAGRPATSELSRQRMIEVRTDLDLMCNTLILDARKAAAAKQFPAARKALDHIAEYFPSKAHPCLSRAEEEAAVMAEE